MPRSISQRLRLSGSNAASVTSAISLQMSSIASMMSVSRGTGDDWAIKNTCRAAALYPLPQNPMQAAPRHDVGPTTKNTGRRVLHIHQLIKAERAYGVIEKQIDVRLRVRLVARRRSEQIKMLDAKLPQLGLVIFQFRNSFVATHHRLRLPRFYNQSLNIVPQSLC